MGNIGNWEIRTGMEKDALFTPDKKHRLMLLRRWQLGSHVVFIGLNPSTADDKIDDPTIRRCIGFTTAWGMAGFRMLNLFSLRATDPRELLLARYPDSVENVNTIVYYSRRVKKIVCCWGNNGSYMGRGEYVINLLNENGCEQKLYCFGKTKTGQPKHPLYLKKDTALVKLSSI